MQQEYQNSHIFHPSTYLTAFFLCTISLLSACTSTMPLVSPDNVRSVVDFTKQLRSDTSAGLDTTLGAALRESTRAIDPMARLHDPRTQMPLNVRSHQEIDAPGYRAIATWWCPRHQLVNGPRAVSDQYGAICTARGGQWHAPYCKTPTTEKLLFLALIKAPSLCSGNTPTAAAIIIEPKGALDSPDYLTAIRLETR